MANADQEWKQAIGDTNKAITRLIDGLSKSLENTARADASTVVNERPSVGKALGTWLPVTLGLITLLGVALKIYAMFADIDKHITRVETAVRVIGAKQGGDTKALVDAALTVALNDSNAGKPDKAKEVLAIANNFIGAQAQTQIPLPQLEFDSTLQKLNQLRASPHLAAEAHRGMIQLADYRSATLPTPPGASSAQIGQSGRIEGFVYFKNSVFIGDKALKTSDGEGTVIDNLLLVNVVFRDATIVYNGGPLRLENVQFINCRFRVKESAQGAQLLEAAVKQNSSLTVG